MPPLDLEGVPETLRIGTSSFSTTDWVGGFYPPGTKPADFLSYYASVFATVEIDATWYAMPAKRTVSGWAEKTPDDFVFSLKVPKKITHEAYLEDCETDWTAFLRTLEPLGGKRGPLLFQFPYVAKGKDAEEYATGADFRRRLAAFAEQLPQDGLHVVEVRNAKWIGDPLLDLLRSHRIGLSLPAYYTMPTARDHLSASRAVTELVTGPVAYVRFLGHHRRMDTLVKEARQKQGKERDWDEVLVDRSAETRDWAQLIGRLIDDGVTTHAYFNNHFAGYAPGSIELFVDQWRRLRGTSPSA